MSSTSTMSRSLERPTTISRSMRRGNSPPWYFPEMNRSAYVEFGKVRRLRDSRPKFIEALPQCQNDAHEVLVGVRLTGGGHLISVRASMRASWETRLGALTRADAIDWLRGLAAGSAELVFADPPYNAGREAWDTFASTTEYLAWTAAWVEE